MQKYQIETFFPRGYIADPYWPAVAQLIDIQKKSGVNRAKSDANRRKALESYFAATGMTMADYEALEKRSKEPFYTMNGNGSEIIIPDLHVISCLVAICDEARAAQRPCSPVQVRARFICSPWTTGKLGADGIWERFATVASGTGAKLSNQRGLRRSSYIEKFTACGEIEFDETFVEAKILRQAFEWGGRFVGIGASRKMGWGRFELRRFEQV